MIKNNKYRLRYKVYKIIVKTESLIEILAYFPKLQKSCAAHLEISRGTQFENHCTKS